MNKMQLLVQESLDNHVSKTYKKHEKLRHNRKHSSTNIKPHLFDDDWPHIYSAQEDSHMANDKRV